MVLDAIAKGTHGEGAHFWIGRMLPPSDRANLSGPYFQNAWGFPGVAWQFPNIYAGRDNGVAYWGQYDGGKFKWQLGAFEGRQGTFNPNGKLLYAGRLTLNLWDPEPGYYNSSTYYGAKDILAIGLVGQSQADGGGTATSTGNFDAFSIDVLMEKNVGDDGGVVSIEGAYYSYTGGMAYTNGTGFWVLGSFLVAKDIDLGSMSFQMQPHVRYQAFDGDPVWTDTEVAEFGVAMISDGHNSRMTMTYGKKWDEGQPYDDSFTIGAQTQF